MALRVEMRSDRCTKGWSELRSEKCAEGVRNGRGSLFQGVAAFGLMVGMACQDVQAQRFIYTCRDANNQLITSDRPITECGERESMRQLSGKGRVLREIPPPLTPRQREEKDAEEARKAAAAKVVLEENRRDRVLFATYQDVHAIEAARQRNLIDPEATVAASIARLEHLELERAIHAKEALAFKDKPLPPLLKRRISDTERAIGIEQRQLAAHRAAVVKINQRYDADKERFLKLSSRPQAR